MKIVGITVELDLESADADHTLPTRTSFDPRAVPDRYECSIGEFDLDPLATVTGGDCAVLLYAPRKQIAYDENFVKSFANVQAEGEVESEFIAPTVHEARDETLEVGDCDIAQCFLDNLQAPPEAFEAVAQETVEQSNSQKWWNYRIGRLTASKAHECASKVKDS